jgi:hypothetical protein
MKSVKPGVQGPSGVPQRGVYFAGLCLALLAAYSLLSAAPFGGGGGGPAGAETLGEAPRRGHRKRGGAGAAATQGKEASAEQHWFARLSPEGCEASEHLRVCAHRASSTELDGVASGSIAAYSALWTSGIRRVVFPLHYFPARRGLPAPYVNSQSLRAWTRLKHARASLRPPLCPRLPSRCYDIDGVATADGEVLATHPDDLAAAARRLAMPDPERAASAGTLQQLRAAGLDEERFPTVQEVVAAFASMLAAGGQLWSRQEQPDYARCGSAPAVGSCAPAAWLPAACSPALACCCTRTPRSGHPGRHQRRRRPCSPSFRLCPSPTPQAAGAAADAQGRRPEARRAAAPSGGGRRRQGHTARGTVRGHAARGGGGAGGRLCRAAHLWVQGALGGWRRCRAALQGGAGAGHTHPPAPSVGRARGVSRVCVWVRVSVCGWVGGWVGGTVERRRHPAHPHTPGAAGRGRPQPARLCPAAGAVRDAGSQHSNV